MNMTVCVAYRKGCMPQIRKPIVKNCTDNLRASNKDEKRIV